MTLDGAFTHLATLSTDRLRIRQMRIEDAEAVFAFKSDIRVTDSYGQEPHGTMSETRAWIQRRIADYECRDSVFWVIVPKEADLAIGECCLWNFDGSFNCAEIGYELRSDHWNRGIMTEALTAVLNYGFDEMDLHRIEACPLVTNEASNRLLVKLGFKYEGTLRERQSFRGRFVDQMYYGLLRGDRMDQANNGH
jgi:[ribosomal protein S5]-alanine N-acetyltransferase